MSSLKKKLILLVGVFYLIAFKAYATPNPYEIQILHTKINAAFHLLMETWKEELYFDIYDLGTQKSKTKLSKEVFAQRMVDLKWKPTITKEEIVKIDIYYLNFAGIHSEIEFESKVNPLRVIKKGIVFPTFFENNGWKFDLMQLIRTPFFGKHINPSEKKEPAKTKVINKQVQNEEKEK